MKVYRAKKIDPLSDAYLHVHAGRVVDWLVKFLRDECIRQRGVRQAVVGLSGGVDSAVTTYLCARAFGPENVLAVRMPYKASSRESLDHARLVVEATGVVERTVEITDMVDGYASAFEPEMSALRLGNVCARCRMIVLYDQAAKLNGLPIGTSNKTERMFGYFTWHGDDAPPINPLGDLFKSQVWQIAEHLGVPEVIVKKAPTADLVQGQTDEGDWGISVRDADRILIHYLQGITPESLVTMGFAAEQVKIVAQRVAGSHYKRHLPTTAMLSDTAINEYYLRPVDY